MNACTHGIPSDFVIGKEGEVNVWRCTPCGAESNWTDGWGYLGNLGCDLCHEPQVKAVYCSPACQARAAAGEVCPLFTEGQGWQWRRVNSSNLEAIGMDLDHDMAAVRFRNGTTYDYDGVSLEDAQALVRSRSAGRHYNSVFRSKYRGVKRGPMPDAAGLPGGAEVAHG